ncbi:MAG: hypothetical protein A2664_00975 [Candidatus Taylorbacteria bacterium RIFCSPHIGHO2_01_FULL_46_22b]|uniref:Uncharacterized protein n=1 Tax=Candidatus Taylorbacteria bacterium RIFCSPHIGHO2_01_FULL_46_22b TaxID=1802301 RepID=A0A1G2M3L1_9BACT|nr:MAG: hypothetical protein A2664_00975 [Candidatus Taylorbacteria bacterium RIFCSPHIGHO2_01_FULL_46_22b]
MRHLNSNRRLNNRRNSTLKTVVTRFLLVIALVAVGALFYDGWHMPVVEQSWGTRDVVRVYDRNGKEVLDSGIKQQILAGRYEHVWVK